MDPRLAEYERIVLDELRGMPNPDKWVRAGTPYWEGWARLREVDDFFSVVEIEEIKLDNTKPEQDVVVLLRDPARRECLFGWRAPAVDLHYFGSDRLDNARDLKDAAEMYAFVLYANLVESRASLPQTTASPETAPRRASPNSKTTVQLLLRLQDEPVFGRQLGRISPEDHRAVADV